MSIMQKMREGTDSSFMQIVLVAVAIAFVFWYNPASGDKSQVVATVNGKSIRSMDFNRAYRQAERRYEGALSKDEEAQLREQVRQGLIESEVILQEARRMGLTISDTEVARQILTYGAFASESGEFENRIYVQSMKRLGYTTAEFEETIREDLLREKLRRLVFTGVTVSEPALRAAFSKNNTKLDLNYVRLRSKAFEADVDVDDATTSQWLQANGSAVQSRYERDLQRLYTTAAQVQLVELRLMAAPDSDSDSEALRQTLLGLKKQLMGGTAVAEVAASVTNPAQVAQAVDVGWIAPEQLSPAISEAVKLLEPGQVSTIIEADEQLSILLLQGRRDSTERPLRAEDAEVGELELEIATQLYREEKAPENMNAYAQRLRSAWALEEVVPEAILIEKGLKSASTGLVPPYTLTGPFDPPAEMLAEATDASKGAVLSRTFESNGVVWLGQVAARQEADMSRFEDEQSLLREQILLDRRVRFFNNWKDDLIASASIE